VESSPETSLLHNPEKIFGPGDQVLFKAKSNTREEVNIWGRIIKSSKSKDSMSHVVVIDEWLLINMPHQYHAGGVLTISKNDVVGYIPYNPDKPLIHVDIQDDAILKITRIDGGTGTIIITIDENDMEMQYSVDHRGWNSI